MVVQSAMEEVRVCQVAPLPQLPQAPPPAASASAGGTADTQQDDGEQSDPEVMQVRPCLDRTAQYVLVRLVAPLMLVFIQMSRDIRV